MDNDFYLKPVRPRVAYQVDFDLVDDINNFTPHGFRVIGKIGERGIEDPNNLLGIYQSRPSKTGKKVVKMPFYRNRNPRTAAQQANRQKFRDAVTSWNGLSDPVKEALNKRAKPRGLTGYNLYLKGLLS